MEEKEFLRQDRCPISGLPLNYGSALSVAGLMMAFRGPRGYREPLTKAERAHRTRRRKIAEASRRRNRAA